MLDSFLQTQFINKLRDPKVREKIRDGADNFATLVENAAKYENEFTPRSAGEVQWMRTQRPKPKKYQPKKGEHRPTQKKGLSPKGTANSGGPPGDGASGGKKKGRCFNCNQFGHFSAECPKPQRSKRRVNNVDEAGERLSHLDLALIDVPKAVAGNVAEGAEARVLRVNINAFPDRLTVNVKIQGVPLKMEIDTGAKASIIGRTTYDRHFAKFKLRPTRTLVWGEPLKMLGEFDVMVSLGKQTAELPLAVVDRDFPSLFGLPWMQYLHLDWKRLLSGEIHNVPHSPAVPSAAPSVSAAPRAPAPPSAVRSSAPVTPVVKPPKTALVAELCARYPHVFGDKPGLIEGFEVHLRMREGATPVFRGPRPVPIPLRDRVEKALRRLVDSGFLEPCAPGPWGTPIVCIPKGEKDVRICGDFSTMLNPDLLVAGRSTPLIDDLSTVNGRVFALLDMDQAYVKARLSPADRN